RESTEALRPAVQREQLFSWSLEQERIALVRREVTEVGGEGAEAVRDSGKERDAVAQTEGIIRKLQLDPEIRVNRGAAQQDRTHRQVVSEAHRIPTVIAVVLTGWADHERADALGVEVALHIARVLRLVHGNDHAAVFTRSGLEMVVGRVRTVVALIALEHRDRLEIEDLAAAE